MLKHTLILAVLAGMVSPALAAATPYADKVYSYTLGAGGGFGLSSLPGNVSGPPDFNFREFRRDVLASQVFSLGIGGVVIVEFTDNLIADGPGVDFTVFENGLIDLRNGRTFYEGAEVFVSADGTGFFDLGYAEGKMTGLIYNAIYDDPSFNPLNPAVSGGDSFDIAFDRYGLSTGLTTVKYVRLVDDGDGAPDGSGCAGFDLDAIAAVHSAPEPSTFLVVGASSCGILVMAKKAARRATLAREKMNLSTGGLQ